MAMYLNVWQDYLTGNIFKQYLFLWSKLLFQ